MKKRIIALAALMTIMSMTACGAKTDDDNKTTTAQTTAVTTEETTAETEAETTETEESVTETEAEVVEPVYIDDINAKNNYDGVTFETTDGRICYYRYSDKKIFDLSEYKDDLFLPHTTYCSGDIAVTYDKVINMNTNTVLYDISGETKLLKSSTISPVGNTGSFMLSLASQNFDDTSSIIVLKNDGSIIDNTIPFGEYGAAELINDRYVSALSCDGHCYFYDTTTCSDIDISLNTIYPLPENDTNLYYVDNNGNILKYNKNTSEIVTVLDCNYCYTNQETAYGYNNDRTIYEVINIANDEVVHFDISSFIDKCDQGSVVERWVCPDYILAECRKSDANYIAMLDHNGNTVFDPIQFNGTVEVLGCSDNYIAFGTYDNNFVIDINTKTVTNLDEGLRIKAFDTNGSDTLVIEKDGYYFLADAATPNDLYSPFDDVE